MRVLIIEDERRLATNIARMLKEKASFAADISTDGEDGLHMATSNPYDLIVPPGQKTGTSRNTNARSTIRWATSIELKGWRISSWLFQEWTRPTRSRIPRRFP